MNNTPSPLAPRHASQISTTCAYCGVGCGVDVDLSFGVPTTLAGAKDHPANHGRLCVKGTHLLDTLGEQGRLLEPRVYGQKTSWEEATKELASRLSTIIDEHGPDSVAFYVSGQLLTEDYYIANKLMKGYIGSANIDTNSRLCMSSAVSAYKRAFGEDVVPCDYRDLEQTDCLVLVGSNAAWTHPVLFQRIERAKKQRPQLKIIVIDPRKTASVSLADLHLQVRPGTDAAIFNGLLCFIESNGFVDTDFVSNHTQGFKQALGEAMPWSLEHTAEFCDVSVFDLAQFYTWFCSTKRALSFYSMGINQSSSGVDKCNSIINCHLATGSLLKLGAGPFSITGQPNAMGGREVGGLANQLAAHLDIENSEHRQQVQGFWQSPTMVTQAGKKAIDMFDAIESGTIKAVWIMATNPAVSLPNRHKIESALAKCECVIVSDCVDKNDSLAFADIALPATSWSEKDGTVTNSERCISRQRALVKPAGNARHDWQIMCDVAKKMGFSGFDFGHQSDIFNEWAHMTSAVNHQKRQLNLYPLSKLSKIEYEALTPIKWPFNQDGESCRPFAGNQFSTDNGKARFVPITPRLPELAVSKKYPLILNSGRLRDHWHTMTRTGRAHSLSQHAPFPSITLHPDVAANLGIKESDIVKAQSKFGEAQAYAQISDSVRDDSCFMPIHFSKEFASQGCVSRVYSSVVDPISGQPESKQVPVALSKEEYSRYITIFSKDKLHLDEDFWVMSRRQNALQYEIATMEKEFSLLHWAQLHSKLEGEWISIHKNHLQVSLLIKDKILVWASFVFLSRQAQQALPAEWIVSLMSSSLDFTQINSLLNVKPDESFLKGKMVCSCFKVHEKDILEQIERGLDSVSKLGDSLKCGTNCGSCKSELQQMLTRHLKNKDDIIPVRRVG